MDRLQMPSALPADVAEVRSDAGGVIVTDQDREAAREQIVETVMLFRQWPQPRPANAFWGPMPRVKFSLVEWLFDTAGFTPIDPSEVEELFVLALTDHSRTGPFESRRDRWEKKVTDLLLAHFADGHTIVEEVATEMATERAEAAREAAEDARRGW